MTETSIAPGAVRELPAEDVRSRRERARRWYGHLADENVEHVADRIRNILTGRRFTWVDSNAYLAAAAWAGPGVRVSCALSPTSREPVTFHRIGDATGYDWNDAPPAHEYAGISVVDTSYVWGISTRHATEADSRAARSAGEKTWTSVVIDGGLDDDPNHLGQIEIQQFNGPGEMLHWVIAVQAPDPGLDEAAYDLDRLHKLAKTPDNELRPYERDWYREHPLTQVHDERVGDALPVLAEWARGGAQ
jgi:hypothetical protein